MITDHIFIERLQFDCIVGVLDHERIHPQPLIIDIELETGIAAAARSGSLDDTPDYAEIARAVREFVTRGEFLLLETLAESTADRVLQDKRVDAVLLTVRKPRAIPGAAAAGVRIYRRR
jgi:dihydroneopterin aldolase